MTDCLFLDPECASSPSAEHHVNWWREADGQCLNLPLEDCAQQLNGEPIALVLPVEVVSAFLVELPVAKDRWIRQALPFSVEEMLAEDVELFHLALGAQQPDQRYRVLAIRRELLTHCLAELDALGVEVASIHVDADMLPCGEGSQALSVGGRRLLGGDGELRMAISAESWPFVEVANHGWRLNETDEPYRLLATGRDVSTNLAQSDFTRRPDNQAWAVWRPVSIVLGVWLALYMGFSLFQSLYYERQAESFAQASVLLYRQLFPEDTRIVNLRAQFAEHLRNSTQTTGGFVGLMETASASLMQGGAVSVSRLDYSKSTGDLALQVKAKDFAELEKLRQQLGEAGLSVQMGSASREEDGVTARVILGGNP